MVGARVGKMNTFQNESVTAARVLFHNITKIKDITPSEETIDHCTGVQSCENGGTCVPHIGGFDCECAPGFLGNTCAHLCWNNLAPLTEEGQGFYSECPLTETSEVGSTDSCLEMGCRNPDANVVNVKSIALSTSVTCEMRQCIWSSLSDPAALQLTYDPTLAGALYVLRPGRAKVSKGKNSCINNDLHKLHIIGEGKKSECDIHLEGGPMTEDNCLMWACSKLSIVNLVEWNPIACTLRICEGLAANPKKLKIDDEDSGGGNNIYSTFDDGMDDCTASTCLHPNEVCYDLLEHAACVCSDSANCAPTTAADSPTTSVGIVRENLALNKHATMSSVHNSEGPEKAVDGNRDQNYLGNSCASTNADIELSSVQTWIVHGEDQPWWVVDLGSRYVVSSVGVVNRADCCSERLSNFEVRIGDFEDFSSNALCFAHTGRLPTSPVLNELTCVGAFTGRYVSVQIMDTGAVLTLCEVEVYGILAQNQAPPIEPTSYVITNTHEVNHRNHDNGLLTFQHTQTDTYTSTWTVYLEYFTATKTVQPKNIATTIVALKSETMPPTKIDTETDLTENDVTQISEIDIIERETTSTILTQTMFERETNTETTSSKITQKSNQNVIDKTSTQETEKLHRETVPSNMVTSAPELQSTPIVDTYVSSTVAADDNFTPGVKTSTGYVTEQASTRSSIDDVPVVTKSYTPNDEATSSVITGEMTSLRVNGYTHTSNYVHPHAIQTSQHKYTHDTDGTSLHEALVSTQSSELSQHMSTKTNGMTNVGDETGKAHYNDVSSQSTEGSQFSSEDYVSTTESSVALAPKKVECPSIEPIANGEIVISGNNTWDTITYTCYAGYFVTDGDAERVCSPNGTWIGSTPQCSDAGCIDPGDVFNAVKTGSFGVGEQVTYECKPGFEMITGDSVLTCLTGGEWAGRLPICNALECPPPPAVMYSRMKRQAWNIALYTCNYGFKLTNNISRIMCNERKRWQGEKPVCQEMYPRSSLVPIFCPPLDVAYSNLTESALYVPPNIAITIGCLPGFQFPDGTRVKTFTCYLTAQWWPNVISCIQIRCPKMGIENGVADPLISYAGSLATMNCNTGYTFIDGSKLRSLICDIEGHWLGAIPACKPIPCPRTEHTVVGRVSVECKADSQTPEGLSSLEVECSAKGKWSRDIVECVSRGCPSVPYIESALKLTEDPIAGTAELQCEEGKRWADGSAVQTIRCVNGDWDVPLTKCKVIICPIPNEARLDAAHIITPTIGSVIINQGRGILSTHKVVQECTGNKRLPDGAFYRHITCDETGQLSSDFTTCKDDRCPPPPVLDNGYPDKLTVEDGDVLTYTCDRGYHFLNLTIREYVIECDNGKWNDTLPYCEANKCGTPPNAMNAYSVVYGSRYQDNITYICSEGYTLEGGRREVNITCLHNGLWNYRDLDVPLQCRPVVCPELPYIPYALASSYDNTYPAAVTFTCVTGYSFGRGKTSHICFCKDSGEWSATFPTECKAVQCSVLITERVIILTEETSFGSLLNYTCNNDAAVMEFKDGEIYKNATCEIDGKWHPSIEPCIVVDELSDPPEEAPRARSVGTIVIAVMAVLGIAILLLDITYAAYELKNMFQKYNFVNPFDDI